MNLFISRVVTHQKYYLSRKLIKAKREKTNLESRNFRSAVVSKYLRFKTYLNFFEVNCLR